MAWYDEAIAVAFVTRTPDTRVPFLQECRDSNNCWINSNNQTFGVNLSHLPPSLLLFMDASVFGWGTLLQELMATGTWKEEEAGLHIYIL